MNILKNANNIYENLIHKFPPFLNRHVRHTGFKQNFKKNLTQLNVKPL